MWFTIATEPDSKLGLEGTLDVLAALTGAESVRQLPDAEAVQDPHGPRDGGRHRGAGQRRRGRRSPTERTAIELSDDSTRGDPRAPGRHAGHAASRTRRPPPSSASPRSAARAPRVDEGAPGAAPGGGDPLPPPRRLLGQRHGRVAGARRADPRAGPADGRLPRHLALLPAADLRGLALLRLHDGPRPLEGGVRRDPRLDRRVHGDRGPQHALLLHRVQEDPASLLHRRLTAGGRPSTAARGTA